MVYSIEDIGDKCTGCNACVSVCAKAAIVMETDKNGFWYPQVDLEKCIHCGKCNKVCPILEGVGTKYSIYESKAYIGWNNDSAIRYMSSSGGIFSAIAEYFLSIGGIVIGAAFDESCNSVRHIVIENAGEIELLRRSKYLQSYIAAEVYKRVEREIRAKRPVLFSGTPCQIAAIKKVIQNDLLYTVDIVCHGVPSPKAWRAYKDEKQNTYNDNLKDINFRSKTNGWKKFSMSFGLEHSENVYTRWFNEDDYGKSFITNIFLRECCYSCAFKDGQRYADISLGDFWKSPPPYDGEDMGNSLILCNTQKGEKLFKAVVPRLFTAEVDIEDALPGNYALTRSSSHFEKRDSAFEKLGIQKFSKIVDEATKISHIKRVYRRFRRYIKQN